MSHIGQRGYIQTATLLNKSIKDIHDELVLVHGEAAYAYTTVAWWVNQFKRDRVDVKDLPRSGAPVSKTTLHNIRLVESLIEEDPRITYDILEEQTSLCRGTLHTIIHYHLGFKKRASRWIPYSLNRQNKQRRLDFAKAQLAKINEGKLRLDHILTGDECWIYWKPLGKRSSNMAWKRKGDKPETVVRRTKFSSKTMFIVFFRSNGPVLIKYLEKGKTINYKYYIENCLSPAFEELRKQRPNIGTRHFSILHDNARPHTKPDTISFIKSNGVKIIDHPPYSPDLAPCDYWLIGYLKDRLNEMGEFKDENSLFKSVSKILTTIPHSEYIKTFRKYKERLQFCIDAEGDYFEHLKK